jgi:hypothetical protein
MLGIAFGLVYQLIPAREENTDLFPKKNGQVSVKHLDRLVTGFERRKTCDTTVPDRGNARYTFGDQLINGERRAVIEYVKTL